METIGVVLLAFGGADNLDAVAPFMTNIMGGRKPPPDLVERIKERYKLIGGGSPLPSVTKQQANEVEKILNEHGSFKVLPGMRYWHPFISEAINELLTNGIKKIIAVSLSPHFSRVTTGAYISEFEKVLAEMQSDIKVQFADGWYDHPLFIKALKERIDETLEGIPLEDKNDLTILFSAHSLPVAHISAGDSYLEQLDKTVKALNEAVSDYETILAFQSKGGGQGEWLGPEVEDIMDKMAPGKSVLVVPVGFACDHIETLYDIDVAQRNHAEKIGIKFYRAQALNTSPDFMKCLADVVLKEAGK